MPIDPLTAQLLVGGNSGGGGLGNIGLLDPALIAAQPEIQLGQQMEQQGTSTAPAYPGAALARALQAGIGASLQKGALSDLAKAYSGSVPALEKLYPKGTPVGDALLSGNPLAISWALNAAPKAMAANSLNYNLNKGETRMGPGGPIAQSNMPLSQQGDQAHDALLLKPTQPALSAAITTNIPARNRATGVEAPPIPIAGAGAAIPPPQPTPGAPTQPSPTQMYDARQQLAAKLQGATNPTTTGLAGADTMPAQVAAAQGAQEQAKAAGEANVEYGSFRGGAPQGSGPGITEPLPTNHGTVIPPVNAQATVPSDPGVLKEKIPSWQKTTEGFAQSIAPSQLAQQRLTTIANAFKSFETGTFSTDKAAIVAGLKGVGIDISGIANDPAAVQLALHENYAETMTQLKAATSRFTQQEFKITSENKQHPNLQPAANLQMLSEDMGTLQQQMDVANDWNAANRAGWKDPQSYETEYLKANPLPKYVAQFRQQIGPLKGMTSTQTPAQPPASFGNSMPRFNSPDDVHAAIAAKQLQSGQKFLTSDGRIGTVP